MRGGRWRQGGGGGGEKTIEGPLTSTPGAMPAVSRPALGFSLNANLRNPECQALKTLTLGFKMSNTELQACCTPSPPARTATSSSTWRCTCGRSTRRCWAATTSRTGARHLSRCLSCVAGFTSMRIGGLVGRLSRASLAINVLAVVSAPPSPHAVPALSSWGAGRSTSP